MLNKKEILISIGTIIIAFFAGIAIISKPTPQVVEVKNPIGYYADDPVQKYSTSTSVSVGKDVATLVAPTSLGRSYLEISNTSANLITCTINNQTPTAGNGVVIFASTTRIWNRDTVPVTAVRCIASTATSTASVTEK